MMIVARSRIQMVRVAAGMAATSARLCQLVDCTLYGHTVDAWLATLGLAGSRDRGSERVLATGTRAPLQ